MQLIRSDPISVPPFIFKVCNIAKFSLSVYQIFKEIAYCSQGRNQDISQMNKAYQVEVICPPPHLDRVNISENLSVTMVSPCCYDPAAYLCLVHVIWTGRRMSKLVLNVKYFLWLSFSTEAHFYNLGPIQGIKRVHQLKRDHFQ